VCLKMAFSLINNEVRELDGCERLGHNDGALVHMTCPLHHSGATDPGTGLHTSGHKIVVRSRMMQWQERVHTKGPATGEAGTGECYCFDKVWSHEVIQLMPDHINPYRLCGATSDSFSSSEPECSQEGTYPTSIYENPGPWLHAGNTSTTNLGDFVTYAADVSTGSSAGVEVTPAMLHWLDLDLEAVVSPELTPAAQPGGARIPEPVAPTKDAEVADDQLPVQWVPPSFPQLRGWSVECGARSQTRHLFKRLKGGRPAHCWQGDVGDRMLTVQVYDVADALVGLIGRQSGAGQLVPYRTPFPAESICKSREILYLGLVEDAGAGRELPSGDASSESSQQSSRHPRTTEEILLAISLRTRLKTFCVRIFSYIGCIVAVLCTVALVQCSPPPACSGFESRHALRSLSCFWLCGFSVSTALGVWSAALAVCWIFLSPASGLILLGLSVAGFVLARSILRCGRHFENDPQWDLALKSPSPAWSRNASTSGLRANASPHPALGLLRGEKRDSREGSPRTRRESILDGATRENSPLGRRPPGRPSPAEGTRRDTNAEAVRALV